MNVLKKAKLKEKIEALLEKILKQVDNDFISCHYNEKKLLSIKHDMIKNSLKSVILFLFMAYWKKLELEFGGSILSNKKLTQRLSEYLKSLPLGFVSADGITYKLSYDDINSELENKGFKI